MTTARIKYSIDDCPVTKKEFLRHQDQEMSAHYVQQQYLVDNKVFSLGQIRNYEKQNLLPCVQYKGGKYFKREDVRALIK